MEFLFSLSRPRHTFATLGPPVSPPDVAPADDSGNAGSGRPVARHDARCEWL